MKISACYIVKDEEKVLERSLRSLVDAVDEIVVVDTGSTDYTINIAQKYQARVYHYPWQGDFAAARNFALTQASGDWIVFLDADEYFAEASGKNLRRSIERHCQQDVLLVKMRNIDTVTRKLLVEFWAPRIFRSLPELRYEGSIHEQLYQAGHLVEKVARVSAGELCLLHTGYSQEQTRKKAERNLQLLKQALKTVAEPQRLYMYLAEAYDGMGDTDQALYYAQLDVANGRQPCTYASRSYHLLLRIFAAQNNWESRFQAAAGAVKDFPEVPEFHAEYAECLAHDFLYDQAVQQMREAIAGAQCPDEQSLEPCSFDGEAVLLGQQRMTFWQSVRSFAKEIRISACIIARNEEKDIGRWIENTRKYSDEIVFVDTGSTDHTLSLTEQAGIQVFHYKWGNDFSQARNYALEQAKGDWIVFLDADETFARPEAVRWVIAEALLAHADTQAIMVPIANIDEDFHQREFHRFLNTRLFRNLPELRYRGKVHEQLQMENGHMEILLEQRLLIWHTGYSSKRVLQKVRRNLELLQKDIAQYGEGPQHYRYLADCYFGLHDYQKSLEYAQKAMDAPITATGSDSDMYREAIESMRQLEYSPEAMLPLIDKALRNYPELPDFYAEKGMVLSSLSRTSEAIDYLERAVSIFDKGVAAGGEASGFRGAVDTAYRRLGELYQLVGNQEQAEWSWQQSLRYNRYSLKTLELYHMLYDGQSDKFRQQLVGIYQQNAEDCRFLRDWAEKYGHIKFFQHYDMVMTKRYGMSSPRADLYADGLAGDWPQIQQKVIPRAAAAMPILFVALLCQGEDFAQDQKLWQEAVELLPHGGAELLAGCRGGETALIPEYVDIYRALLPTVIQYGQPSQLQRYGQLAVQFGWAEVKKTAQILCQKEKWALAMELYGLLPSDVPEIDSDFWYEVGMCAYYLKNFPMALEAWAKAREMGASSLDIASYMLWAQEGMEEHD